MMEWGDIGLKMGEDVLEALREGGGGSASEIHSLFGERVSGLIASALDLTLAENERLRAALRNVEWDGIGEQAHCPSCRSINPAKGHDVGCMTERALLAKADEETK